MNGMKITAFYYMDHADLPEDPLVAESEARVEVGGPESTLHDFYYTYALNICTIEFVRRQLEKDGFFFRRSLIIVKRFEDSTIKAAIETILPIIDDFAEKH